MDWAVEVEGLCHTYPDGTIALRNVNLRLPKGRKVAILGPNGAGKSTFVLHLNALFLPQRGTVKVAGIEVKKGNEMAVRQKVGLVFQDPDDQVFSPTVWDDVAFGPENLGLPAEEVERRVERSLQAVQMLSYARKPPQHLSYGQKKRVAIAGVLAMEPEIIVLDEPLAYLDPAGKRELTEILNLLHREGTTVVVATHDVDFAVEWAEEVVVFKEGSVLRHGDRRLLTDPAVVEEASLDYPTVWKLFFQAGISGVDPLPLTIDEGVAFLKKHLRGK
ncbi:MAG: cobalt/nickel transport system ATP-binding protein [Eubacteriales bacterium]|nr:cobalt/nickel transport system ATP-binding protein [Eubacteriales bacterium]MDN5363155.1 cobalt/nickel transport system ATP-binding protein [Eubacteriales bacterium]